MALDTLFLGKKSFSFQKIPGFVEVVKVVKICHEVRHLLRSEGRSGDALLFHHFYHLWGVAPEKTCKLEKGLLLSHLAEVWTHSPSRSPDGVACHTPLPHKD